MAGVIKALEGELRSEQEVKRRMGRNLAALAEHEDALDETALVAFFLSFSPIAFQPPPKRYPFDGDRLSDPRRRIIPSARAHRTTGDQPPNFGTEG